MFASTVSNDRCRLYTVMRTDMTNYDRVVLTYPPSDYQTAAHRAAHYQRTFGDNGRWDYRVCACG